MLIEVALTHPCGAVVHLVGGAWTTPRGKTIENCCPGCGECLGSPFTRAEETTKPKAARCRSSVRG